MIYCVLLSYMLVSKFEQIHYWFAVVQMKPLGLKNVATSSKTFDEHTAQTPVVITVSSATNLDCKQNKQTFTDESVNDKQEKQDKVDTAETKKEPIQSCHSTPTPSAASSHIPIATTKISSTTKDLSNLPQIITKTSVLATAVFTSTFITFSTMIGSLIVHFFTHDNIGNPMFVSLICGIPYLLIAIDSAVNIICTIFFYYEVTNVLYKFVCCTCIYLVKMFQQQPQ